MAPLNPANLSPTFSTSEHSATQLGVSMLLARRSDAVYKGPGAQFGAWTNTYVGSTLTRGPDVFDQID
jgi:hypothetical protein